MTAGPSSPPTKRIKLELSTKHPSAVDTPSHVIDREDDAAVANGEDTLSEEYDHCSICLQPIVDRTVVPTCSHEFCFECLVVWTDQSRRCPLCSQNIGEYLIHHIRSKYDFQKHYLPPLRTSPRPQPVSSNSVSRPANTRRSTRREREWGRNERRERERALQVADDLERAVEKRRWIYRHNLYAKHVASNPYTRYRPLPTPSQFAANPDLITRATIFVRRELRVWGCLDVEFLTTFTISLMKSLDIRSEPAIKLLAEFLDMDSDHDLQVVGHNGGPRSNAEHFAHELYCYLRSPYRDLTVYDSVVQYDVPEGTSHEQEVRGSRNWRWRSRSPSQSRRKHDYNSRPDSPSAIQSSRSKRRFSQSESVRSTSRSPQSRENGGPSRRYSLSPEIISYSQQKEDEEEEVEAERLNNEDRSNRTEYQDTREKDRKGKGRAVDYQGNNVDIRGSQDGSRITSDFDRAPGTVSAVTTAVALSTDPEGKPEYTSKAVSTATRHPSTGHEKTIRPRIPQAALTSVQMHLTKTGRQGRTNSNLIPPTGGGGSKLTELSVRGAASKHRASLEEDNKHKSMGTRNTNNRDQTSSGIPSLLHRMSDPVQGSISDPTTDRSDETPVSSNTTVDRLDSSTIADPKKVKMSAPEIMARTRARLARNNHIIATNIPSSMVQNEPLSSTSPISTSHSTSLSPGSPSPSASTTIPSSSDLRRRLLMKLEDERRAQLQPRDDNEAFLSVGSSASRQDVVDSPPHGSLVSPSSAAEHEGHDSTMDAEMREAELRRKARLRARLVAAKKNGEK
ncbi:hypothetical protein ABKN59_006410 [Abortiporus biennis]